MLGKQLLDNIVQRLIEKEESNKKRNKKHIRYASIYFSVVDFLESCFGFIYYSKLRRAAFVVLVVSLTSIWISNESITNLKGLASVLFNSAESIAIWSAAILFFVEIPDRKKQEHYEAWQLINSAMGQTASGGRISALEDLNKDKVDLSGLSVPKADLSGISLSYSKCSRANFMAAELDKAIFSRSDLSRAIFTEANLEGVSFIEATLEFANLDRTNLRSARMRNARLRGASLIEANLQSAHFPNRKSSRRGVKVTIIDPGTVISGADFTDANLSKAQLQRGRFTNTILEGANLEDADLSCADLSQAIVSESDLDGAILCYTKLPENISIDPCRDCHRTQFSFRPSDRRYFD